VAGPGRRFSPGFEGAEDSSAEVVVVAVRCNVGAVSSDDRGTAADRQLLDQLAARGLQVTARQLKRWRDAGLLSSPVQQSAGRGRGRPSVGYPPAAVDQATAIVDLLGRRVPLDEMGMAMFLRAAPVSETAVRRAVLAMLSATGTEAEEDPADQADELVAHLLRRARRSAPLQYWSRRARGYGERVGVVLGDMLTAVAHRFLAETQPSPEAQAVTAHTLGTTQPQTQHIIDVIGQLTLDTMRVTAETVTLPELQQARQTLESALSAAPEGQQPNFRVTGLMVLGLAAVARRQS